MAMSSLRASTARDSAGIDSALLILRIVLGALMLVHGVSKLPPPDAFIAGVLAKANLPAALAYGVYVGEIVAPIMVIVGVWTRLAGLVIAINMITAVLLVGLPHLFTVNKYGGYALEVEALYLFTAVALALAGAGRYSVGGRYGPMN
jgi:putative oxidoreductase